jgi:hypothetical protein
MKVENILLDEWMTPPNRRRILAMAPIALAIGAGGDVASACGVGSVGGGGGVGGAPASVSVNGANVVGVGASQTASVGVAIFAIGLGIVIEFIVLLTHFPSSKETNTPQGATPDGTLLQP